MTFSLLEPVPELRAATLALLGDTAGASPVDRALVAAAVSRANRCRPCVAAHVIRLHSLGEHELAAAFARGGTPSRPRHAALIAWAEASRNPVAAKWTGLLGPELTGTVIATHFVNRIVPALPGSDPLPAGMHAAGEALSALRDAALKDIPGA
jgi:AhpD family alkylhydroperoxidase